jgi:hypothetical protein
VTAADDAIGKVMAVLSKDPPAEEISDAFDQAQAELLALVEQPGRRSRQSR